MLSKCFYVGWKRGMLCSCEIVPSFCLMAGEFNDSKLIIHGAYIVPDNNKTHLHDVCKWHLFIDNSFNIMWPILLFIKWPMSMIFKIHCMAHDVWSQRCVAGHKVEGEHVWSPLWFGSFYKHVFYSMIINIRDLELIYWCEVGMIKPLIYIGWLLNFGHCGIYILLLETYVSLGAKKWRTRQHITFDLISFFQLIFHYYK